MKILLKIIAGLVGFAVLIIIGLSIFLRFYLTDEKVKSLVIPEAEKALGRDVRLGAIDIGLFSGISIKDIAVKEQDRTLDFFKAGEFVLNYDLWPLLEGKLTVSAVSLNNPSVRIARDKTGKFNFESLAVLTQPEEPTAGKEPAATGPAAVPFALTVERISLKNARLSLRDATGEIPDVDAEMNLNMKLALGGDMDLAALAYKGDTDFSADIVYGELKPHIAGNGEFDQNQAKIDVDLGLDQQKINLSAAAADWVKAPRVTLDLASDRIDLDKLLALLAGLPRGKASVPETGTAPAGRPPAAPIASSLPAGLTAGGKITIGRILYGGLAADNFKARYSLVKGVASVKDLSTVVAGGGISGETELDLNLADPAYKGGIEVKDVGLGELLTQLAVIKRRMISGRLESSLKFSGQGMEWPKLADRLSADASFNLKNGRFAKTKVVGAVAALLKMPELNDLSFERLDGNLQVKEGKVVLNSGMSAGEIQGKIRGTVGLDGALDVPVTLRFSGGMAEKLKKTASVTRYLSDNQGAIVVNLKMKGTVDRPVPTLNVAGAAKELKKNLLQRGLKELGKSPDKGGGPKLLKRLFR